MKGINVGFIIRLFFGALVFHTFLYTCEVQKHDNALILTTIYGQTTITAPVLIELIQSPAMERLNRINQYGVTRYAHAEKEYTRFTHSLGVLHLLIMYGASLEEQIDGLLHDVSHTVFSHVGDAVFNHRNPKTSYQDEIHEWFLDQVGITQILDTYGFAGCCSKQAKKSHRCLEQDKPDLCADRIEYNLSGGLLDGFISIEDVHMLIAHLHFENQQWFFDDADMAKKFAKISLQLSQARWGAVWNRYVDYCACQALLRAVDLKAIDKQTIHFSDDATVWNLLNRCNDAEIAQWIKRICLCEQSYMLVADDECEFSLTGKFLGTDPLIKTDQGLQRLSTLDPEFAQEYKEVKQQIAQEWYIRCIS